MINCNVNFKTLRIRTESFQKYEDHFTFYPKSNVLSRKTTIQLTITPDKNIKVQNQVGISRLNSNSKKKMKNKKLEAAYTLNAKKKKTN